MQFFYIFFILNQKIAWHTVLQFNLLVHQIPATLTIIQSVNAILMQVFYGFG